jgi:hypothetical protein
VGPFPSLQLGAEADAAGDGGAVLHYRLSALLSSVLLLPQFLVVLVAAAVAASNCQLKPSAAAEAVP